jgi:hypothetical protein
MVRTLACITVLLYPACGGAAPPPEPQLPDAQEEAVSATPEPARDSTDEGESDPGELVAPPPAYGNKVVRRRRSDKSAPNSTR